ncbi:hypothetical protein CAPTEDRAFT_216165 [Capitella teleta]|uniref:Uncharacterized protein n=1 Tax=Capitella teleta TaxID=283909 RepID=R7UGB0_CAPTE|nr:hypothetical protein CAPTEDRAFT_216165 [Capitella teleta]|eukprot:ELU05113.1 hypothetical protein CAPTEDRAFT_216165 [Capitella teleta]
MNKYSNLSDSEKRRLSDAATRSWRRDSNGQLPMRLLLNFDKTDPKKQATQRPAQPQASVDSYKPPPSMLDFNHLAPPTATLVTQPPAPHLTPSTTIMALAGPPPQMIDPRYTCYPFAAEPMSPPPPPPGYVNGVVTVASEYHGTTYYHQFYAPVYHQN